MTQEIGLKELIQEIQKELLAQAPDDPLPLFCVAGVEPELSVAARKAGQAGVMISVVHIGGSAGHEWAQTVRVTLQPLYSREEMRRLIERDPVLREPLPQVVVRGATKDLFGR